MIDKVKKLREENERAKHARQRKIAAMLLAARPGQFDDASARLEKRLLRESLGLLIQQSAEAELGNFTGPIAQHGRIYLPEAEKIKKQAEFFLRRAKR